MKTWTTAYFWILLMKIDIHNGDFKRMSLILFLSHRTHARYQLGDKLSERLSNITPHSKRQMKNNFSTAKSSCTATINLLQMHALHYIMSWYKYAYKDMSSITRDREITCRSIYMQNGKNAPKIIVIVLYFRFTCRHYRAREHKWTSK